jgi:LytS/YehU family sensor histidine kinase
VVVNVASAAGLGALVIVVVRRLPETLAWPRAAALHLMLGSAFSFAWLAAVDAGLSLVASVRAGVWTARFLGGAAIPWQLFSGLMVYAATAAAATAARNADVLASTHERAMRAEAARVHAELDALHARFQPHFLFNALHGIATLVRHDPVRAATALEALGDLLRAILRLSRGDADEHRLAEEWEIVERYVALERLRLGERLRLCAEIEPSAHDCLVPPFLLQPLVENAILHAVAPSKGGATVRIGATIREGVLRVRVEDDGPGCEAGVPRSGTGLEMVRERLAALHPRTSSVLVRTGPGRGFGVEARLPARRRAEADVGAPAGHAAET